MLRSKFALFEQFIQEGLVSIVQFCFGCGYHGLSFIHQNRR